MHRPSSQPRLIFLIDACAEPVLGTTVRNGLRRIREGQPIDVPSLTNAGVAESNRPSAEECGKRVELRVLAIPSRVLRALVLLQIAERRPEVILRRGNLQQVAAYAREREQLSQYPAPRTLHRLHR